MKKIYTEISVLHIQILALIAWADDKITVEERSFLQNAIKASLCDKKTKDDLIRFMDYSPQIDKVLNSITNIPKDAAVSILRSAYSIAAADGSVHPKELEVIDKIAIKLGIDEKEIEALHKWLEISFQCELIEIKLFKIKSNN